MVVYWIHVVNAEYVYATVMYGSVSFSHCDGYSRVLVLVYFKAHTGYRLTALGSWYLDDLPDRHRCPTAPNHEDGKEH